MKVEFCLRKRLVTGEDDGATGSAVKENPVRRSAFEDKMAAELILGGIQVRLRIGDDGVTTLGDTTEL